MYGGWGVGMGFLWILIFSALVIVAAVGIAAVLRGSSVRDSRDHAGPQAPTPLETLRRRYAGGEISRDEFERIRSDLS